jgi:hypothetical protein
MPLRRLGSRLALALLGVSSSACSSGSGIEGKYYNSASGEYALELKGGKVTYMQGQEGRAATYEVRGDSLFIHDPRGFADQLTFGIQKDGTLSLGILGSLTKHKK